MTDEQQNQVVALLLAIAMDGKASTTKEDLQKTAKKFLATLPAEMVSKAAGTQIQFG